MSKKTFAGIAMIVLFTVTSPLFVIGYVLAAVAGCTWAGIFWGWRLCGWLRDNA